MPILQSSYRSPLLYRNAHVATIVPSMLRKVKGFAFDERERIDTKDGDFLDLDWIKNGNSKLIILSHGLEGSSQRPYIRGLAKKFSNENWDILAWNCRSCSGELNRKPRFYHHGASEDLEDVVLHAVNNRSYNQIALAGFSLGGSLVVKYLGHHEVPETIIGGAVVSVPFSIKGSVDQMNKKGNGFYRKRFLKKLITKMKIKASIYPDIINIENIDSIKSFEEYDNRYTAPLHGFDDADDFYFKASAGNYLSGVKLPLLIINALNDPLLAENCYPVSTAESMDNIYLEMPEMGGHVGFLLDRDRSWMDTRIWDFINNLIG